MSRKITQKDIADIIKIARKHIGERVSAAMEEMQDKRAVTFSRAARSFWQAADMGIIDVADNSAVWDHPQHGRMIVDGIKAVN